MRALPRALPSPACGRRCRRRMRARSRCAPASYSVGHGVNMQPSRQLKPKAMQDELAMLIGGQHDRGADRKACRLEPLTVQNQHRHLDFRGVVGRRGHRRHHLKRLRDSRAGLTLRLAGFGRRNDARLASHGVSFCRSHRFGFGPRGDESREVGGPDTRGAGEPLGSPARPAVDARGCATRRLRRGQ